MSEGRRGFWMVVDMLPSAVGAHDGDFDFVEAQAIVERAIRAPLVSAGAVELLLHVSPLLARCAELQPGDAAAYPALFQIVVAYRRAVKLACFTARLAEKKSRHLLGSRYVPRTLHALQKQLSAAQEQLFSLTAAAARPLLQSSSSSPAVQDRYALLFPDRSGLLSATTASDSSTSPASTAPSDDISSSWCSYFASLGPHWGDDEFFGELDDDATELDDLLLDFLSTSWLGYRWFFEPQRIVAWGGHQLGFAALRHCTVQQITDAVERLVAKQLVRRDLFRPCYASMDRCLALAVDLHAVPAPASLRSLPGLLPAATSRQANNDQQVHHLQAELAVARHAQSTSDEQVQQLQAELAASRLAQSTSDEQVQQLQAELTAARHAQSTSDEQVQQLQAELAASRLAQSTSDEQVQQLQAELTAARNAQSTSDELQRLQAELTAARHAQSTSDEQVQRLQAELATARHSHQSQLDAQTQQIHALQQLVDTLNSKCSALTAAHSSAAADSQRQLHADADENARLAAALAAANATIAEQQTRIEQLQRSADSDAEFAELSRAPLPSLDDLFVSPRGNGSDDDSLFAPASDSTELVDQLQARNRQLEQDVAALTEQLSAAQQLQRDNEQRSELDTALAAAEQLRNELAVANEALDRLRAGAVDEQRQLRSELAVANEALDRLRAGAVDEQRQLRSELAVANEALDRLRAGAVDEQRQLRDQLTAANEALAQLRAWADDEQRQVRTVSVASANGKKTAGTVDVPHAPIFYAALRRLSTAPYLTRSRRSDEAQRVHELEAGIGERDQLLIEESRRFIAMEASFNGQIEKLMGIVAQQQQEIQELLRGQQLERGLFCQVLDQQPAGADDSSIPTLQDDSSEVVALRARLAEQQQRIAELERTVVECRAHAPSSDKLQAAIEGQREKIAELEEEVVHLNTVAQRLRGSLDAKDGEAEAHIAAEAELRRQLAAAEHEARASSVHLAELRCREDSLSDIVSTQNEQLAAVRLQLDEQRQRLDHDLPEHQHADSAALQQQLDDARSCLDALDADNAALKQQARSQVDELTVENARLHDELERARTELGSLPKLQAQIALLQDELEETRTELGSLPKLQAQIALLQDELEETRTEVDSLPKLQAHSAAVKDELERARQSNAELKEKLKLEAERVAESDEDRAAVNELKDENEKLLVSLDQANRTVAELEASRAEFNEELKQAHNRVAEVEDSSAALKEELEQAHRRRAELEASSAALKEKLEQARNRVAKLKEDNKALKADADKASSLEEDSASVRREMEEARRRLASVQSDHAALTDHVQELLHEIAELRQRNSSSGDDELAAAASGRARLPDSFFELCVDGGQELTADERQLFDDVAAQQQVQAQLRDEREQNARLHDELAKAGAQLAALQRTLADEQQAAQRQQTEADATAAALRREMQSLCQSVAALQQEHGASAELEASQRRALDEQRAAVDQLEAQLEKEREQTGRHAAAVEAKLKEQREAVDKLEAQLKKERAVHSEAMEQLQARLEQEQKQAAQLAQQISLMQEEFESAVQRQQDADDELARLTAQLQRLQTPAASSSSASAALPESDAPRLPSLAKDRPAPQADSRDKPKPRKIKAIKPDGTLLREPFRGPDFFMQTKEPADGAPVARPAPRGGRAMMGGLSMGELRGALSQRGGGSARGARGRDVPAAVVDQLPDLPTASSSSSPVRLGRAATMGALPTTAATSPVRRTGAAGPGAAVFEWLQSRLKAYPDIQVSNFSGSFASGLALCAVLHSYVPQLIDLDQLRQKTPLERLNTAFDVAASLGCTRLLDAEDMVQPDFPPEKLSVMTYCSTLQHALVGRFGSSA